MGSELHRKTNEKKVKSATRGELRMKVKTKASKAKMEKATKQEKSPKGFVKEATTKAKCKAGPSPTPAAIKHAHLHLHVHHHHHHHLALGKKKPHKHLSPSLHPKKHHKHPSLKLPKAPKRAISHHKPVMHKRI